MNITDSYPVLYITLSDYNMFVTNINSRKARCLRRTRRSYHCLPTEFRWWQSHVFHLTYNQAGDFHDTLFSGSAFGHSHTTLSLLQWCFSDHSLALASRIRNKEKVHEHLFETCCCTLLWAKGPDWVTFSGITDVFLMYLLSFCAF